MVDVGTRHERSVSLDGLEMYAAYVLRTVALLELPN